jgi:hypothetical protein
MHRVKSGVRSHGFEATAGVIAVLSAIALSVAAPLPATAQDDARTKQLRLLCAQLSGDLTDPGGIAAFRRCLTTRDPVGEIRRDNNIGGGAAAPAPDRPNVVPPSGFGHESRHLLAEGVERFQTADGHVFYAIDRDGKLWRFTADAHDARGVDQGVASVRVIAGDVVFVLGRDGKLFREQGTGGARTPIDQTVADFWPLDTDTIFVRGTDGKLWREKGDVANRSLVDRGVEKFQAVDANLVFVLGTDGVLWREAGDLSSRVMVAKDVAAFQYVANGAATYVLAKDHVLWRQIGKDAEKVDFAVAGFQAVDMHLAYVLGTDGRLWRELGTRDQAELVDGPMLAAAGAAAFHAIDAAHVIALGGDHKLWLETMPSGR